MDANVSHRGFFAGLALALSLWLCAGRVAAAGLDDIPWVFDGNSPPVYAQTGDVELTQDVANKEGAMWDPCTINLNESFDLTFTINFGGNVFGCGADGMAFVLQNSGTGVVGADSAEHGYDSGSVGSNSLAVAMDTWTNPTGPYNDPPTKALASRTTTP